MTFLNLFQDPQPGFFSTASAGNFVLGGSFVNPIDIFFNATVTGAAFNLLSNDGTSSFEALLGGSPVFSFNAGTGQGDPAAWYGFDGIAFGQIEILPGGDRNAALIDNIEYTTTPVPEPTSVSLVALGSVGLAGAGRRKLRRA